MFWWRTWILRQTIIWHEHGFSSSSDCNAYDKVSKVLSAL